MKEAMNESIENFKEVKESYESGGQWQAQETKWVLGMVTHKGHVTSYCHLPLYCLPLGTDVMPYQGSLYFFFVCTENCFYCCKSGLSLCTVFIVQTSLLFDSDLDCRTH